MTITIYIVKSTPNEDVSLYECLDEKQAMSELDRRKAAFPKAIHTIGEIHSRLY